MVALKIVLAFYAALSLAAWLWFAYAAARLRWSIPRLSERPAPEPDRWPRLSVIVPARDEADTIEPALRSLLGQDYPDLEIVVVDDRSTDGTGEIVDRLAGQDPRGVVLHLTELPEGWLGKVNAMNKGLARATGELVLFTDADVRFEPGALRRGVVWFLDEGLDFMAAFPRLLPAGAWVDAVLGATLRHVLARTRPWAVRDPKSRAFMGVGAFNLVRRSALERTEGLAWLRLDTADDAALCLLLKRSGARCAVVGAADLMNLHWHRSIRSAARGAEKALVPIGGGSFARTLLGGLGLLVVEAAPVLTLVPLAWPELRPIGFVGVPVFAAFVFTAFVTTAAKRWHVAPLLVGPLVAPIVAALIWRAGYLGWRRGGAVWRGTFYSTDELVRGARVRL